MNGVNVILLEARRGLVFDGVKVGGDFKEW